MFPNFSCAFSMAEQKIYIFVNWPKFDYLSHNVTHTSTHTGTHQCTHQRTHKTSWNMPFDPVNKRKPPSLSIIISNSTPPTSHPHRTRTEQKVLISTTGFCESPLDAQTCSLSLIILFCCYYYYCFGFYSF